MSGRITINKPGGSISRVVSTSRVKVVNVVNYVPADPKPFEYNASDLIDGSRILDHNLNTLKPKVTIFADGVREVEQNTKVEVFNNGNGLENSVRITHYGGGLNYKVDISK